MRLVELAASMNGAREDNDARFDLYPSTMEMKAEYFGSKLVKEEKPIELGEEFYANPEGFVKGLELEGMGYDAAYLLLDDKRDKEVFDSLTEIPPQNVCGCINLSDYEYEENPDALTQFDAPSR